MFIRSKKNGERTYLQLVENERQGSKVIQKVHLTLGRLDQLQQNGHLDSLLRSGLRFSQRLTVLDAHKRGQCTTTSTRKIGATLLLEKLWKEIGIDKVPPIAAA